LENLKQKIVVGSVVKKDNYILMVKHSYGPTKGIWDFPRGHVESGESIEAAACREIKEETSIIAEPEFIFGIRDMIRNIPDIGVQNDLVILWSLKYLSGDPTPDGEEILETTFMSIDEIIQRTDVASWAKEVIKASLKNEGISKNHYIQQNKMEGTMYWRMYSL